MKKNTPKDTTALTARRSIDDFDCELPDDALDELLAPKRPRILGRPSNAPDRRRVIVLAVLALVLGVAAGVVVVLIQFRRRAVRREPCPRCNRSPARSQLRQQSQYSLKRPSSMSSSNPSCRRVLSF
jgi:hypothetical protein